MNELIRVSIIAHRLGQVSLLILCFFGVASAQRAIVGKVVGISDGDTITVLDANKRQHKIRLSGIDAPEKGQDFSSKSKTNLSNLVLGQIVTIIGEKIDRHGRRVGKVLIDGQDANLAQLKAGLAWHFKIYARELTVADRKLYADAELEARKVKLNIWSVATPLAPWDFRAGKATTVMDTGLPSRLQGKVIGNRNSSIYHLPGCRSYNKVAPRNRVMFSSAKEAEKSGFRKARDCN